jgi:hypothetical protein
LSAAAVWFFYVHGWTCLSVDSESHLNIARRITDNLTPGYREVGTVWLPLLHWMILPLVESDTLWRNGLAGAIPPAICFVAGGTIFFAAVRRIFDSTAAGMTAAALVALNPNMLFLQSSAMTEAVFLACLAGILYCSVRFAEDQNWWAVLGTGIATLAGTLTRYEGWFVIPFVVAYFLIVGKQRRLTASMLVGAIATLGPLFWFGHNWWLNNDPLGFYSGPWSARAIQAGSPYPGMHNWPLSFLYYGTAVRLCAGWLLSLLAVAGAAVGFQRRAANVPRRRAAIVWPMVLLALPALFYVWSMHSSGSTPIFVPTMWPNTYYNIRYGIAALPLLAFCAAALVDYATGRGRKSAGAIAGAVVIAATLPWLLDPHPGAWIFFRESEVNTAARVQWTDEIVRYLAPRYRPGSGIVTSYGDIKGIYRRAGIPLRDTLSVDNDVLYDSPLMRPDLLRAEWAVVRENDPMRKSLLANGHYTLELRIVVKNEPAIEVYRR